MPELPEVETTRQGLLPLMKGEFMIGATVRNTRLRFPVPEELPSTLRNTLVEDITRRSKYLLIHLNNQQTLIIHLGMSGRLVKSPKNQPYDKHDHVIFHLPHEVDVRYHDPRRFGMILLTPTAKLAEHPLISRLGPEPLEKTFTSQYFMEELAKRTTPIKTALMDNHLVVGIGNIYANEILFRAHIHPERPANSLTEQEIVDLFTSIQSILLLAIESGGTTLRDYVQTDGKLGYFFENFKVYGRTKEACLDCETPLEKITQAQRSTWFCPTCQPTPLVKTHKKA